MSIASADRSEGSQPGILAGVEFSGRRSDDAVSEALRGLRVRSTIFCRSSMRAPWGFAVKAHGRAAFHILLEGECALDVVGAGGSVKLGVGDVVVLPHGPGHTMRSDPTARVEWLDDILAREPLREGQLTYGGQGPRTELVCGVFAIEDREAAPVLQALPAVAVVRGQDDTARWLRPLLELVSAEVTSFEPGSDSVVARLTDVLLLQTVRHALFAEQDWPRLFNSQIATTLRLMREAPERHWTVDNLARAVSMSRTSLTDHFRSATGMTPIRYLTKLRIAGAARLLGGSGAGLAEVAARVGYSSEYALSKAFLREVGVSPRAYRHGRQSTDAGAIQAGVYASAGAAGGANGRASK